MSVNALPRLQLVLSGSLQHLSENRSSHFIKSNSSYFSLLDRASGVLSKNLSDLKSQRFSLVFSVTSLTRNHLIWCKNLLKSPVCHMVIQPFKTVH